MTRLSISALTIVCWLMMILSVSHLGAQEALDPNTVVPITLPNLGEPFLNPPELAGQSGFFWTRFGTEQAVMAMKEIPILQDEITKIEKAGTEQAVKLDQVQSLTGWFQLGCVVLPLLAILIEEIRHAPVR